MSKSSESQSTARAEPRGESARGTLLSLTACESRRTASSETETPHAVALVLATAWQSLRFRAGGGRGEEDLDGAAGRFSVKGPWDAASDGTPHRVASWNAFSAGGWAGTPIFATGRVRESPAEGPRLRSAVGDGVSPGLLQSPGRGGPPPRRGGRGVVGSVPGLAPGDPPAALPGAASSRAPGLRGRGGRRGLTPRRRNGAHLEPLAGGAPPRGQRAGGRGGGGPAGCPSGAAPGVRNGGGARPPGGPVRGRVEVQVGRSPHRPRQRFLSRAMPALRTACVAFLRAPPLLPFLPT